MQLQRAILFGAALTLAFRAFPATVLVLQFHNNSQYSDLDWVGESIAETLRNEFRAANEIVLDRASRAEAMRRLALRSDAQFTKGTLIKLGQTLDTDYLCYGTYNANLPANDSQLKNSSLQVSARFLDLRKMHDGPELSEAGKLTDLSRLEEHLAWASLKYLEPRANFDLQQFMIPQKLTRVDAEESYIRGLLSSNKEKQQKWFSQAVSLAPQFTAPAFELGKLALDRKEYRQAVEWFGHVPVNDPRYAEARFEMGLGAYGAGDYSKSADYFREVSKTVPLNEVYNNLAAAEYRLNSPAAIDDFRRALDGDQNDSAYRFNLALALLRHGNFDESTKRLEELIERDPDEGDARDLLNRIERRDADLADVKSLPRERLKNNFDETAFRELKAMLQPKATE
ncbi:MAG: tetratricopeptide repeat protein [Acidobacteriaceae bacterium]|nr:tetratricopeptide repeat protein [Acidobacteriaceae bacterium]MBV9781810.1 tetratricopeptide repeat protein [Acidobacteriaceae bacterium]